MTDIQILALATPILIVVIAYAYTTYILSRKPVAVGSATNGSASSIDRNSNRRLAVKCRAGRWHLTLAPLSPNQTVVTEVA